MSLHHNYKAYKAIGEFSELIDEIDSHNTPKRVVIGDTGPVVSLKVIFDYDSDVDKSKTIIATFYEDKLRIELYRFVYFTFRKEDSSYTNKNVDETISITLPYSDFESSVILKFYIRSFLKSYGVSFDKVLDLSIYDINPSNMEENK